MTIVWCQTHESGGNTTYYLYGLGAIGEKTTDWAYSLPDGVNTPRQLADPTGEITLSARYTPWGDALETYGTGNFTFGYFGGVMDAATGLLYVGNGQYYDPVTGRFLTRDANPSSPNPYVPWNPFGALIGPLGLLSLIYGRKKKKGSQVGMLMVLVLVGVSVGITLAACGGGQQQTSTPFTAVITTTPGQQVVEVYENGTVVGTYGVPTSTPIPTLTATLCPPTGTPTPSGTPTPTPTPSVIFSKRAEQIRNWAIDNNYSPAEVLAMILQRESLNAWRGDADWFAGDKNGKPDPAETFKEAATRWFWTWIKDADIVRIYGMAANDSDREAMMFNWIVPAMQSEDNLTEELMITYYGELKTEFRNIAGEVLKPSNATWMRGDGMWGWANKYLYDSKAWPILNQENLYHIGEGPTTWYIINADTLRKVCQYNTNPNARCK